MSQNHLHASATLLFFMISVALSSPSGAFGAGRDAGRAKRVHPPESGIYQFDQLTNMEAASIDRGKTIVLQPVGMLGPHGPHLPTGTDDIIVEALVEQTAGELRVRNPTYNVLIMPLLPVAAGPLNEVGYIYTHPASVVVSRRVVEAVLTDWALNFVSNSWTNFFFVSFHHDPSQYAILTEVSRFVHEGYGVNSANVSSMVLADSSFQVQATRIKGAPDSLGKVEFELDAGAAETSLMLALAPDLVDPSYRQLASIPVGSWDEAAAVAQRLGWPYYFGRPAEANAEFGKNLLDLLVQEHAGLILATMADHTFAEKAPHFEDSLKREFSLREIVRNSEKYEVRLHQKYQAWLRKRAEEAEGAAPAVDDHQKASPAQPSGPDAPH